MNYEIAVKTIRKIFSDAWGDTTKVAYDDVKFDIPTTTWVRFNISHYDGNQASIGSPGSNKFRRYGLIAAQVFQPQGQGSLDARKKVDLIIPIFQGKQISGITFYDVQAREIGNDGAGWYQVNVLSKFYYDTIA
ncbi:phage tail terminator-like protein [Dyadobacter bucti]|uniref:phage tail terminator-like protein n=1 Tax=Dyadobacter bucti TaxID=2572203 RepID=UPI001109ACB5|nr:phage tail terminator-like protein [Dyadobacter bucti]